jgi:hypothetical protein
VIDHSRLRDEIESLGVMSIDNDLPGWEPRSELETTIVFARLAPSLGFLRLRSTTAGGFPDLNHVDISDPLARLFGKQRIALEMEYDSSGFRQHRNHRLSTCDMVVCWTHDVARSAMFLFPSTQRIRLLVIRDIVTRVRGNGVIGDLLRSPQADNECWMAHHDADVRALVEAQRLKYPLASTLFPVLDESARSHFYHRAAKGYVTYYHPFSSSDWSWHHAFELHLNAKGLRVSRRCTSESMLIASEEDARHFAQSDFVMRITSQPAA